MALLPLIPARPSDRPETFAEYQHRRAALIARRQVNDALLGWLASPECKVQAALERSGWLTVSDRLFMRDLRQPVYFPAGTYNKVTQTNQVALGALSQGMIGDGMNRSIIAYSAG
jgi:hypothetical protein